MVRGERRGTTRVSPHETPWSAAGRLRHGQDVVLVNVSQGGALIESASALNPGARTDLQLLGKTRRSVPGRVARCRITALSPLRFEGAIAFDECLQWEGSG